MSREISGPEQMRQAVADYVTAAHRAYLTSTATLPPALAGGLPLLAGDRFSVLAVGAGDLHLIATRQSLPPLHGPEVEMDGEVDGLRWRLRFYDPVVLPELGLLQMAPGSSAGEEVRRVLGIRTWLYHLVASPTSGLTPHHAGHAGVALANGHAAAARDFETMRQRLSSPELARLVDEMEGAAHAGLVRAQALLAAALAPHDAEVARLALAPEPDPERLRRAVLSSLAGGPGASSENPRVSPENTGGPP
jgi:hypothetical protein